MMKSKLMQVALGTAVLALIVAASSHALDTHENILTFSSPVALPGVVLPAGSYVFGMANPTAVNVVVVREKASGKPLYTGFTNTVERPRNMPASNPIAFAEAPANQVPPISAWYEIGKRTGHQFLYR